MATPSWSTHHLDLGRTRVRKRFAPGRGDACEREWRALTLLAEHAPGLAPAPLAVDLDGEAPEVVMGRLPGTPLRGRPLDGTRVAALVAALDRLHTAVPPAVSARLPRRPGLPEDLLPFVRARAPRLLPDADDEVGRALGRGLDWLDRDGSGTLTARGVEPVFGSGDGNLANYLWDGRRVRIVDFEDSGRSDRAFELAEVSEHVSGAIEAPWAVDRLLVAASLTAAESARLVGCRRLLALVWLVLLARDARADAPRNPPGTVQRQARRLAELLG